MERYFTSTWVRDCGEEYVVESELLSLPGVVREFYELRRFGHERITVTRLPER